jgi:hypothetical protein
LREVQRDLARAESLMKIDRAQRVTSAYSRLVAETRRVAGGYMRKAWEAEPITEGRDLNVPLAWTSLPWKRMSAITSMRSVATSRGIASGDKDAS